MSTLTEFLTARLKEDAAWAREASRHDDEPLVEGGEHWHWACYDDDALIPVDSNREHMEHDDHFTVSLRSVEEYPYRSMPGTGPSLRLASEEVLTTTAAHIARHDPARVLAEVAAKRQIVEEHRLIKFTDVSLGIIDEDGCMVCHCRLDSPDDEDDDWSYPLVHCDYPCQTLRALASVWRDHPDYDPAWA